jgi:hypothetical protein
MRDADVSGFIKSLSHESISSGAIYACTSYSVEVDDAQ